MLTSSPLRRPLFAILTVSVMQFPVFLVEARARKVCWLFSGFVSSLLQSLLSFSLCYEWRFSLVVVFRLDMLASSVSFVLIFVEPSHSFKQMKIVFIDLLYPGCTLFQFIVRNLFGC